MPYCDSCNREHDELWAHCRACSTSGSAPGDLAYTARAGDRREYYCAFCGRIIVAAELGPDPRRLHYPEGLPIQELLQGEARPGRYFKLVGRSDYTFEVYDAQTGLFVELTRMIPKPAELIHPDGWPQEELLVNARRVPPAFGS